MTTPFKLYKRSPNEIEYREAWFSKGMVVDHWGICGDRGRTQPHPVANTAMRQRWFEILRSRADELGFQPIPASKYATLIVQQPIAGHGTPEDLELRHRVEDYLHDLTGWLGLGHCDGGSIGSGSMEIFCHVVDFDIAHRAVTRELATSAYRTFRVLDREQTNAIAD